MSEPPAGAGAARAGRPWTRTLLRVGLAAAVGAALGTRIARWLGPGAGAHAPGGAAALGFSVPVYVSIGLWLAFSFYWQWAARNASVAGRQLRSIPVWSPPLMRILRRY